MTLTREKKKKNVSIGDELRRSHSGTLQWMMMTPFGRSHDTMVVMTALMNCHPEAR